jgi:hypothetical protein
MMNPKIWLTTRGGPVSSPGNHSRRNSGRRIHVGGLGRGRARWTRSIAGCFGEPQE